MDYVEECRAAGVPVPDTVLDFDNGWTNRGSMSLTFLTDEYDENDNEIWSWESAEPQGVCLALPRWIEKDGVERAEVLGLICMGTETSRACFFDNPKGTNYPRGEARDIEDFVGGYDLIANQQGKCTDCHAGENPFIVHPEDPAFDDLHMSQVLRPDDWYEPIIPLDPAWPQNPGPIALPSTPAGQQTCDQCHEQGREGGRFPDVARLNGYCGMVLEKAPASSCSLMPPAEITGPRAGDTEVELLGSQVLGSHTRIWSTTEEIGDNGGSVIELKRPLLANELIRVVRELAGCQSQSHYQYVVQ